MRTNHQGQRRHPFRINRLRRHDRARDVHNSFKATLDHGRRPDMTAICAYETAGVDVLRT